MLIAVRPSSLRMFLNSEAATSSSCVNMLLVTTWCFSVIVSGNAHLNVEVSHNVRRAALRCLLRRLSDSLRETVQCLRVESSTCRVLRLRRPVHHSCCYVFLQVSSQRFFFHICFFTTMDTPADMFDNRAWPSHRTSKCQPCCELIDLCV